MKKRIALVTGGAGFIGSHIVDLLLSKNFKVIVVDNLSGGHHKNISHNLFRLFSKLGIWFRIMI